MTAHYDDLQHKTFLVTGASSGIGRAVSIALGEQGAKVVITGRNQERLQNTAQQVGDNAISYLADITQDDERQQLIEKLPQLDGVCHAAGIIDPFPIRYLDEKRFDKVFNINAKAPILLTSLLLRKKRLNDNSALVFLSTISSNRTMQGGSLYSASKAAIEAFSHAITLEHAAKGIRANCLKPGLVRTALLDKAEAVAAAGTSKENTDAYVASYPLGLGKAEDVAQATLFLLSDASKWMSGADITLDGGFSKKI